MKNHDWLTTARHIIEKVNFSPDIAIILGSGLGGLARELDDAQILAYENIPGFPKATAPGHEGQLIFGTLCGKKLCAMNGRFHYYEGCEMGDIAFPIRVLSLLGVTTLIVTCAVGGINKDLEVGDLMIINDHIKFFDESPLRGPNVAQFGERFNDMTYAYSPELIDNARNAALRVGIQPKTGVYAYMSGPSYETPAEIRALSVLGADVVGMSTVPEVITAVHCGIKVLGIACVSNMAAGISPTRLTEKEVLETGERVKGRFAALIKEVIKEI